MKSSTEGREEASLEEKETKHSPCLIASQTHPFLLISVQAWGLRWNKTIARVAKPSMRGILASVATGGQWCAPSFTDLWSLGSAGGLRPLPPFPADAGCPRVLTLWTHTLMKAHPSPSYKSVALS